MVRSTPIYLSPGFNSCQLKASLVSSAFLLLISFSTELFKSKSQTHNHFTHKYFSIFLQEIRTFFFFALKDDNSTTITSNELIII